MVSDVVALLRGRQNSVAFCLLAVETRAVPNRELVVFSGVSDARTDRHRVRRNRVASIAHAGALQRDPAAGEHELLLPDALARARDDQQPAQRQVRPDGNDQAPADSQLLLQRLRNLRTKMPNIIVNRCPNITVTCLTVCITRFSHCQSTTVSRTCVGEQVTMIPANRAALGHPRYPSPSLVESRPV